MAKKSKKNIAEPSKFTSSVESLNGLTSAITVINNVIKLRKNIGDASGLGRNSLKSSLRNSENGIGFITTLGGVTSPISKIFLELQEEEFCMESIMYCKDYLC